VDLYTVRCSLLSDYFDHLFALLWIKEEITERMAAEFQGDLTRESILQALDDGNSELAGDEKTLVAPGIALLLFAVSFI